MNQPVRTLIRSAISGCLGFSVVVSISTRCYALDYVSEVLADNPSAYWRLGENSGTVAASQVSAPGQNGTYTGGFVLGQTGAITGGSDTAALFPGNAAFQTTGAVGSALFSGVSAITVELWIKPNSAQTGIHYLEYGLSGFSLEGSSLNPTFYVNNVGLGTVPLTVGSFTHVALELDGTNARIFTNGSLSSTTAFSTSIAPDGFGGGALFLASRTASGRFVNATIDEVAVYPAALSQTRIQAHFDAASTVPEPVATSAAVASLLVAGAVVRSMRRKMT